MYETITPESIKADILKGISGMDTREGSFIDTLISPIAYEIWKYYTALGAVEPIAFVNETSGVYIDKRCAEYNIHRKSGTKAKTTLSFFGKDGTVIPKGKVFLTGDGLEFLTMRAATLTNGTAAAVAEAAQIGEKYNISENELVLQLNAITGLDRWTNTSAAGGMDEESDESLVKRLYEYLQNPATSGNAFHYRQWAKETQGVGNCKIFPLWAGAGSVKVVITDQSDNPATEEVVAACAAHIEEVRPIGAAVTVVSAQALAVSVAATVVIDSTTTIEKVREQFETLLSDYLKSITFAKDTVVFNRIAFMLLDIDGVQDYTSLTVNGGTGNLTLTAEQIPTKGEISLETT